MRTARERLWAAAGAVIALSLGAGGGHVWAQGKELPKPETASPSAASSTQAELHYKAGLVAAKEKKWAEAYQEFLKAYELAAEPKNLAALSQAEIAIGRNRDAAVHLTELLKRKSELDEDTIEQAQKKLDDVKKKLGQATITVNLEGAEVLIDGVVVGTSPLSGETFVDPGRRTFQARKRGFTTAERSLDVTAESKPTVALELKQADGPEGPGPNKGEGPKTPLLYAGIAVTGGLMALGTGTMIGAFVKKGQVEDQLDQVSHPCGSNGCQDEDAIAKDIESTKVTLSYVSIGSFIGAGVAGGLTLAYWMKKKRPTADAGEGSEVSWVVMPAGGGVLVSGRW